MPRVSQQYEQAQRQRIVDGAALVFADHGYALTTIDQICLALKISKGALYVYFQSKEELFIAVLKTIFDRRYASLADAAAAEGSIQVKFAKLLERLGSLVTPEDSRFIRLWVESFLQSSYLPALQAIKTESHQQFDRLLQDLLRHGQLAGEVDPGLDLSSAAEALMALADGLMLHSLVPEWGITPERVNSLLQATLTSKKSGRDSIE